MTSSLRWRLLRWVKVQFDIATQLLTMGAACTTRRQMQERG
jgi:hypothetical protein